MAAEWCQPHGTASRPYGRTASVTERTPASTPVQTLGPTRPVTSTAWICDRATGTPRPGLLAAQNRSVNPTRPQHENNLNTMRATSLETAKTLTDLHPTRAWQLSVWAVCGGPTLRLNTIRFGTRSA